MGNAIGIDLGTTKSVVCYSDGQSTRVLLNSYGEETTPSVVSYQSFDGEEEWLVGMPALSGATLSPQNTIFSIKRLLGRRYHEERVQRWLRQVPYRIVESQSPVKGFAAVKLGDREYLPEDIVAMLLREIKRSSEAALGDAVTHAVLTVPAHFGELERAAIRAAGKKAGLVIKALLPEPTAAAIAFGLQPGAADGRVVLVIDLGGGACNVSILAVAAAEYCLLETQGDPFLGGDDFNEEIVALMLGRLQEEYGVDLSRDARFRLLAMAEAEVAKRNLAGSADAVTVVIPEDARVRDKTIHLRLKVTRAEFERAIQPHLRKCKNLVLEALAHQGLSPENIDDVLLMGGSTAVSLVRQMMEESFGESKIRRNVHSVHGVAMGAAVFAYRMRGIECPRCKHVCEESEIVCPSCRESLATARSMLAGMEVTEVSPRSLGIQVESGSNPAGFIPLIAQGQLLPMRQPKRITAQTAEEGQKSIRVPLFEGFGASDEQNTLVGVIEYPRLPACRRTIPFTLISGSTARPWFTSPSRSKGSVCGRIGN